MKIVIPGRLISLNDYVAIERGDKYAAAKKKKEIEEELCYVIKSQKPQSFTCPVFVTFSWFEQDKRRDMDNIAFAKKFILDALKPAGVIKNDGWKHIKGFRDLFYIDKENPRIEIEIKAVE